MNENKKILIVGVAFVVLIGFILLSQYVATEKGKKIMIAYNSLFTEGETNLIVIGSTGCDYCKAYVPIVETVTEQNDLEYYYVDLAKITSTQEAEVLEKVGLTAETFKGTPYTALVVGGKKVDEITQYVDQTTLENFLIENKVIEGTIINIETDYQTFKDAYNSNDTKVLIRAASWCGNCTNLKSTITSLKKQYDFEVYFLHADLLTAEEQTDYATFGADIEAKGCGYPLTIATKAGKIIDSMCGAVDADTFYEFLQKHNVVKQ